MKDCPTCRTPRDESEFNRNRARYDGLQGECRYCQCARQREYGRLIRARRRREAAGRAS